MKLFSRKKKSKLECCTNNLNKFFDDQAIEWLEELMDEYNVNIVEMDCLSYCEECVCSPYLLLNNQFINGETPDQLLAKVKQQL
ncbi:DUF1450 domain-containing protein [Bacillus kwashiorkori]|uniref:DUF1450 domain-containing protein n=1 Tax=Bacillus kwashiorkori TaxID=1522318 RepID=UPI000780892B|nr:DUF1450 domain-containing protein [Bacillus kwashiorkori]